jgi:hypothetical protein
VQTTGRSRRLADDGRHFTDPAVRFAGIFIGILNAAPVVIFSVAQHPSPETWQESRMSTRSWAYQPSHPAYRTAWPTILHDTRRIVVHVRQLGIVIAGPDGHRCPVLDAGNGVEFNGDATTDLAGGPFVLLAPLPSHPRGLPTATASCTTHRKPYALAVTAVLLRCALLVPEAFAVASDESWDQWAHGSPGWPL